MGLRAGEMDAEIHDAEIHAVAAHPRFREAMHEYMAFQANVLLMCC